MTAPWKQSQLEPDTPFLRYFDEAMRYLHATSREFAEAHPDAARRLGMLEREPEEGPVRAIYEAFAFLQAQLRSKLDDGLPEVTDPLIDNLYEHAGRPIPSLSILECTPQRGIGTDSGHVPAGAVVLSAPVGTDAVQCVFRTTQPVKLLPLSVEDAHVAVRADGRTVVSLTFGLRLDGQRERPDLSRIRLYLDGDRAAAAALYVALTRQVAAIDLRLPSVRDGELQRLHGVNFEAAGFGPSTRLWPVGNAQRDRQLDREQTMLEYAAFPQKFHFVDLCGFDAAALPIGETQMTFEVELNGRISDGRQVGRNSFRLFCTPVINLFEVDAPPLQPVDRYDREHRVRMPPALDEHAEPYDVLSVIAADPEGSARHAYRPFAVFRNHAWELRYEKPERYFYASTRFGVRGRELWIKLDGEVWAEQRRGVDDDEVRRADPDRYLTVRALAHNGRLPRMALAQETVTEMVSGFTGVESVRNLTAPTQPLYPPRYFAGYDWRVLGHFSAGTANELNRIHAEGVEALRETLELYDWAADDAMSRRIDAIKDLKLGETEVVRGGCVQRVLWFHVELDATGFDGLGDATLFGDVLDRFVGRYACVHHDIQLVVTIGGEKTVYPRTKFQGAPF